MRSSGERTHVYIYYRDSESVAQEGTGCSLTLAPIKSDLCKKKKKEKKKTPKKIMDVRILHVYTYVLRDDIMMIFVAFSRS